eukprot:SAG11_NODE_837_length_6925_cov_43.745532_1_plen_140_part_00
MHRRVQQHTGPATVWVANPSSDKSHVLPVSSVQRHLLPALLHSPSTTGHEPRRRICIMATLFINCACTSTSKTTNFSTIGAPGREKRLPYPSSADCCLVWFLQWFHRLRIVSAVPSRSGSPALALKFPHKNNFRWSLGP